MSKSLKSSEAIKNLQPSPGYPVLIGSRKGRSLEGEPRIPEGGEGGLRLKHEVKVNQGQPKPGSIALIIVQT